MITRREFFRGLVGILAALPFMRATAEQTVENISKPGVMPITTQEIVDRARWVIATGPVCGPSDLQEFDTREEAVAEIERRLAEMRMQLAKAAAEDLDRKIMESR